jgi:hypothetical protein
LPFGPKGTSLAELDAMQKKSTHRTGFNIAMVMVGLLGGGLAGNLVACDSADAAFDCQAVCSKYQECLDKSYDVGKCRSNCRDKAAADAEYKHKADVCEACINDQSCKDSTLKCAFECSSIVP